MGRWFESTRARSDVASGQAQAIRYAGRPVAVKIAMRGRRHRRPLFPRNPRAIGRGFGAAAGRLAPKALVCLGYWIANFRLKFPTCKKAETFLPPTRAFQNHEARKAEGSCADASIPPIHGKANSARISARAIFCPRIMSSPAPAFRLFASPLPMIMSAPLLPVMVIPVTPSAILICST